MPPEPAIPPVDCVIHRVTQLPADIAALVMPAKQAGFRFLQRLVDDWHSGVQRFDTPGAGRIRRVFIHPAHQGQGIGRALMAAIEKHAQQHFPHWVLRTDTAAAAQFYERLGYDRVTSHPQRTHQKRPPAA